MNRKEFILLFFSVAMVCAQTIEEEVEDTTPTTNKNSTRPGKMFSFLQVVRFPRNVCSSTSNGRNGTCYASDECISKNGLSAGSCANGFGVCCVFVLACGQTSSENVTFLVLGSTTTPPSSNCRYKLCENCPSICRIRLDFTTFTIAGPVVGTSVATGAASLNNGGAIGQCVTDAFSISAPNNVGSPEICGINTGQHLYIDTTSGTCATANFRFGTAAATRAYDIMVTQYMCGDEMAGPPDCLQYFTGNTGVVSSFNFALGAGNTVPATTTHLANQFYSMCFRRNVGKCAICFAPIVPGIATTIQGSFGLSIAGTATETSATDSTCSTDYLVIPNSNVIGTFTTGVVVRGTNADRYCGRFLSTAFGTAISLSICTTMRPFKIIFRTDADEITNNNAAGIVADAGSDENSGIPGGIIGFSLAFNQVAC